MTVLLSLTNKVAASMLRYSQVCLLTVARGRCSLTDSKVAS